MPGAGTSTQQANTASKTQPWKPAQPALKGILGGVEAGLGNVGPNANEMAAFDTLRANAGNTPDLATPITGLATDLQNSPDYSGNINSTFGAYNDRLSPIASMDFLDPMKTPGLAEALSTLKGDISNQVNGYFAGAGRDLSGANANTLARGLASGMAPLIMGQYNTNVGNYMNAANSLYGAGNTTTGMLSANDQQRFDNRGEGINMLGQVPMAQDLAANRALAVEGTQRGLPISNLGQLASIAVPIAGLGSQTTGTTSMESTLSPIQQLYLAAAGFGAGKKV